MTDRELIARHLEKAADYHQAAGTPVVVDPKTLRQIKDMGAEMEAPINVREPGAMYPATARRYAQQLRAKDREVAA